jgi:hypothetical protein
MKKKINGYSDMIRYTLGTFEKQIDKVEDSSVLSVILEKIQNLYHELEDLTFYAYRNKKEW